MTMITPSYLGETIEYSSLHACRSTLEDPTSMHDFRETPRVPSLASLVPLAFSRPLDAAMVAFARTRDPEGVLATIRAHYDLLGR